MALEPTPMCRQQLEEYADFINKMKTLQHVLEVDILSCDAKWTLFVAAAFSYRYNALLRPFPPQFATEQLGYDIDSLVTVIKDVPKLCIVLQTLVEETKNELSAAVVELLYWVLVEKAAPNLRLVEHEEFTVILNAIDDKQLKNRPTHVFEVTASEGYHSETQFKGRTQNLSLKLAFMSNKLDCYYSLLQNGFPQNMENNSHLLLTTDLQTSLKQSPYCAAWGSSKCGSIISCSAICEFAFDTDLDKITANENHDSCVNICLNTAEKVRLRYLIFYGRRFSRSVLPSRRFFAWIYNYRFCFSLLSHMLILLTIGVGKGEWFKLYAAKQYELVLAFFQRFIARGSSSQ